MLIELFKNLFRIEESLGRKKLIHFQRKGIMLAIMLNNYLMKHIKKPLAYKTTGFQKFIFSSLVQNSG